MEYGYGILTLLPAILVIVTAVKTKRTTEALLIGVIVSYLIICISDGENFVTTVTDSFFSVVTDYDTMWLVVVCGLFGSLIALINKARGTNAFARFLGKICKTEKTTLFVAWILGIIIFIDDYMNILTVSACTKKLADKRKAPREALAYIIDSTGAPVCVLLPFSTWAIFFSGVFYEQESIQALGYGSAIQTYIHTIPYMFYAIAAVLIVPLFIFGIVPKLGAMKKAYERTRLTGRVYSEASERFNQKEEEVSESIDSGANIWDFILPIAVMIIVQFVADDMFIALIASILVCGILYIPRKKMGGGQFCDLWIQGFADLMPSLAIIIAALFMRQASEDLMLSEYVIGIIEPFVSARLFPVIAFITVAGLGFITGSNWGIPAVCAPIIIPLGAAVGANLLLVMAAIVCGGTFCSHACFYSDATVLTSSVCGIENMEHVYTQIPYAVLSLVISCVAFLIAGLVM